MRIVVQTTEGIVKSDYFDLPDDGFNDFMKCAKNLSNTAHISLPVNGNRCIFNPQHVVWVRIDK